VVPDGTYAIALDVVWSKIGMTIFIASRREIFTVDIETMLSTCNSGLRNGLIPTG
jgi:hypothetical protein